MIVPPILQLGVLAALASLCLWLAERLRMAPAPLLLGCGTMLQWVWPQPLTWQTLMPLLGITVCLSFFEGGLVMGSRKLELAGLGKKLVAICPKLGWVLMTALGSLLLGLPSALCLLFGALLMVFAPKSVAPLVARLDGDSAIQEVLYNECYLVSCVGTAWVALMVLVIGSNHTHPGAVETLLSTTRLFVFGALVGYLGARALAMALQSGLFSSAVREPATLSWLLLCYGAAHSVLPGAGLVVSAILGKTLAERQVELPRSFYSNLQHFLVGLLGVAIGLAIPVNELLDKAPAVIGFALLVLAVRPLLVLVATFRLQLEPVRRRNLWLVAPRGVITLGVAGTVAVLLAPEVMPEAARLPAITYWVVLTSNLIPWLVAFFLKPVAPATPS